MTDNSNGAECVQLDRLCSKGKSSLRQKDVENDGPYLVYGASGVVGRMSVYQNEHPYVAVVKDGAGVGRAMLCAGKTSVLGTMQALLPKEGTNLNYLLHLVRSLKLGEDYSGSTIPHIYFKDYGKRMVPVPTISRQAAIAGTLDSIERLESSCDVRCSKLDELVKSQFVEMFGDPFANDFGWEERRLGDLLAIARGGSPRPIKEYLTDSPDGINWIKIGDAEPNSRYITRTAEKIKPEGEKKSRKVKSGDFLLSNSMSFGKPYILTIDGCIHDGWLVLSDYEEHFNKLFLWELLDSPALKTKFSSSVRGGVVNNLNKDLVADTVVPVPSLSLQCKFADFVTHVDKLRTETQRQKQDLQTLYDSLAQEYFAM